MKSKIGITLIFLSIFSIIAGAAGRVSFIWFIPMLLVLIIGYFLIAGSSKKRIHELEKVFDEKFSRLKATGESILLEFENCEFKDSSYSHDIVEMAIPSYYGLQEITRSENVNQSALIYYHKQDGNTEKFISAFPCSADALKFYVLQKKVTLYIDRNNRNLYFFDLKE